MKIASEPRPASELRILVAGGEDAKSARSLPSLLRPGDLVVVNDAATLPASLPARTAAGDAIELRLAGAIQDVGGVTFAAVLFGSGDYRIPTEHRPPPPRVSAFDVLRVGPRELRLVARVMRVASFSARLVDVSFAIDGASSGESLERGPVLSALYAAGRPVQYTHVPKPLALWDVQNAWAGRPWAAEMPSAGRVLATETMLSLRRRGIEVASVTHAAGLSSTGDAAIDARLPLPERFEVSPDTARAVLRTRARRGRVVAIGTSVVRALESAARLSEHEPIAAASGTTDLVLGPSSKLAVVDGVLTGVHESDTTHFSLLGAFVGRAVLDEALATAERAGLLGHELGDALLVWAEPAMFQA